MTIERRIIHRGQWGEQKFPNSFETFHRYGGGVEADVLLLNDGKTLAVAHPADFEITDEVAGKMSPLEFAALKVQGGEQVGGAAPFFREYLAGCYDRGISTYFEVKGSTPDRAVNAARRIVETIKEMQTAGAFKIQGQEHSEFLESMGIHSISSEAVAEAKRALEETGLRLKLGLSWLSGPEQAGQNPIAVTALRDYQEGKNWERAGLRVAKELGCNFVFFIEPSKITDELVQDAHKLQLELYVYIRPAENSAAIREKLLDMKVDKLLY